MGRHSGSGAARYHGLWRRITPRPISDGTRSRGRGPDRRGTTLCSHSLTNPGAGNDAPLHSVTGPHCGALGDPYTFAVTESDAGAEPDFDLRTLPGADVHAGRNRGPDGHSVPDSHRHGCSNPDSPTVCNADSGPDIYIHPSSQSYRDRYRNAHTRSNPHPTAHRRKHLDAYSNARTYRRADLDLHPERDGDSHPSHDSVRYLRLHP